MNARSCFFIAVLAATCLESAMPAGAGAKFEPPDGNVLVFAGQNDRSSDSYVKTTGVTPAGFMLYTSVQKADGLSQPSDYGAGESCGQYIVDKYPRTALQIGLYMVDVLDDIPEGVYDENLDKIGTFIKGSERPVFLRIGYEFDGPHNHYAPDGYIKAYRYIADRFKSGGIDNIAYVWHSYASFPAVRHMDWYPGDEYVDWFGISFFAQHESEMKPVLALASAHNKPVMIAESTPAGLGTRAQAAWDRWFARYFAFIDKNGIKALSYINCDWDALPMFASFRWRDCRLAGDKTVKNKWIEELSKEKYLRSSAELFGLLDFSESGREQP